MEKEYSLALVVDNLGKPSYKFGTTFPKRKALIYEVETKAHHMGHLEKEPCNSKIRLDKKRNLLYVRTAVEDKNYLFTRLDISSADEAGKYHGKSVKRPIKQELSDKVELNEEDYKSFLSTRAYFWEN